MIKINYISDVQKDDILLLHMIERKFTDAVVYIVRHIHYQPKGHITVSKRNMPEQGGVIDQKTLNVTYHLYRLNIKDEPEYFL